ncbi:hypothetical protein EG328_000270 [Venturia inaequalis]|uniref:Uncharacterized protein n=1 Tax=Venturia inaequalis TaxID=5025 RepID=A0A8H3U3C3_VENIN|nr:hypothetical protein EG328_000270 [Venturia inaequalis]KAE9983689.1 hypothetical protein EG327_005412 [Venturia inaequalis]RDI89331.1 hypothetical protein Vi05172_g479 [Venturia inaequalis]
MPSQPTASPYTYSRSSSIVSFDSMHEEAFPARKASISSTTSTTSNSTTSSTASSKLDTKDIASANRLRYATHVAAMFGVSPTALAATLIPTSTCASGHDHL